MCRVVGIRVSRNFCGNSGQALACRLSSHHQHHWSHLHDPLWGLVRSFGHCGRTGRCRKRSFGEKTRDLPHHFCGRSYADHHDLTPHFWRWCLSFVHGSRFRSSVYKIGAERTVSVPDSGCRPRCQYWNRSRSWQTVQCQYRHYSMLLHYWNAISLGFWLYTRNGASWLLAGIHNCDVLTWCRYDSCYRYLRLGNRKKTWWTWTSINTAKLVYIVRKWELQ